MDYTKLIKELSLVLLYLTSWEEDAGFDLEVRRSWRSYDWDALDSLEEEELISFNRKSKSAYLTDEGAKAVKDLIEENAVAFELAYSKVSAEIEVLLSQFDEYARETIRQVS